MLMLLVLFYLPEDGSWYVDDTVDYTQHFTGHLAEMQGCGRSLLAYVIMVIGTHVDGMNMLGVFSCISFALLNRP